MGKDGIYATVDMHTVLLFSTLEEMVRATCPLVKIKKGQKIIVSVFSEGKELVKFSEVAGGEK